MNASLSITGLALALLLPWIVGALWLRWLLRGRVRCNAAVILGHGFFIGWFAVTLLLRLWDAALGELGFAGPALCVAGLAGVGLALQWGRVVEAGPPVIARPVAPPWQLALSALLLALLAWRYAVLFEELTLRPLYAWDAWMNWAPKAVVWFHQQTLVEFAHPHDWLQQQGEVLYTLGNRFSSDYPETVPLILLWSMLGGDTADHGAIYLPWVLAPLALGLALYGHLRLVGLAVPLSVLACYLLLSMPYLNVHAVLAGYADIWLAAAFSMAVFALYEWERSRHWAWGLLICVFAVLCTQLKVPGVILCAIIVVCALRTWFNLRPRTELLLLPLAALLLLGAAAFELVVQVPYLGRVELGLHSIEVGRLGRFEIQVHPVGRAFVESLFVMINWHLFWYLLPPAAVFYLVRARSPALPGAAVLASLACATFVACIFVLTEYYRQALNLAALNRAILYPVPGLLFCVFTWIGKTREAAPGALPAAPVRP